MPQGNFLHHIFFMQDQLFRFKQFSVAQDKCAMKVNTDGVLLGAWANIDEAENILDIGTGTGVIALMMAQKNLSAHIDAIDAEPNACEQAKGNFSGSLWAERLHCYHTSLQDFGTDKKYDIIISNPPYFVNDFKTEDHRRNIAKHSVSLSYTDLIAGISRLLTRSGRALLVLPSFNISRFESFLSIGNLFITKRTEVSAVQGKAPYLALLEVGRKQLSFTKNSIVIQHTGGSFTDEYMLLTRDFYLKF
jgi:tRNA1Val (adenine37-N6)-methyltransferase